MEDQKKEDLIISRPQSVSSMRKGTEMTATVVGWFIWAVLCRPLVLLILWVLGVEIFYEHMIRLKGIFSLADSVLLYYVIVVVFYLIIRGWSSYNQWKFRGKDRRVRNPAVSSQDLEQFFKLPPKTVKKVQAWKDITVDFQTNDQLLLKETAAV